MHDEPLATLLRPLLGPAWDHIEISRMATNFGHERVDIDGSTPMSHVRGRTRYTLEGWLRDSAFAANSSTVLLVVTDMLAQHHGTLTFRDYAHGQRGPRAEFKMTVFSDAPKWTATPLADAALPEVRSQVESGDLTADEGAAAMNTIGRMEMPNTDLDALAASMYNIIRHPGELDDVFRSRISTALKPGRQMERIMGDSTYKPPTEDSE